MRVIPAVVQHLLGSRAERFPPKIQRRSGHSRRADAPEEASTSMGPEPAIDYVRRAIWGMLYADDACVVYRSPQGLAKMMEVIIEVCRAFALTVSDKKTETMCMPPLRTPRTMARAEAAGQIYKQVQSFTYLGGTVTETPGMSVKIAKRTRACWMRIRRYLCELYDQSKVELSLKIRMV